MNEKGAGAIKGLYKLPGKKNFSLLLFTAIFCAIGVKLRQKIALCP
jgi:hypothetical protein